jgi:hypothetical protein
MPQPIITHVDAPPMRLNSLQSATRREHPERVRGVLSRLWCCCVQFAVRTSALLSTAHARRRYTIPATLAAGLPAASPTPS